MSDASRPDLLKFDRVLVVDPSTASAKMLANLLRSLRPSAQVYGARDAEAAMMLMVEVQPELVFVEAAGPGLDGMAFARQFRRSDHDCREAPMIMISAEATAAQILGARDAGVHEFMRRPFTMGDLQKRLEAVSGRQLDWIEAVHYVGPDRRRFNSADYKGPGKRRTDGPVRLQGLLQALKIVQSAVAHLDAEPVQAIRVLNTQARLLIDLCAGQEPLQRVGEAAGALQAHLQAAAQGGAPLARGQLAALAAGVIQAAPEEAKPKAA